jgi:phosphatidate phosphatase APP1
MLNHSFWIQLLAIHAGIGGVLSQVGEDGEERVIAYASLVLSKPERYYCVTRREVLAAVHFTKHFRLFLLGQHIENRP